LRNDKHKQTGNNQSYKVDLNKNLSENIKIGINRNTGLRNPTLYELFGTDSYGYSGNRNLKPEKALQMKFIQILIYQKIALCLFQFLKVQYQII
jgi:outer membrane cobalamin receptor